MTTDGWPATISERDVLEVQAQTVLFREEQEIRTVYLVEEGVVTLQKRHNDRDVLVALRSTGWLVAATSALVGKLHGTTASTLSSCRLRTLPVSRFHELVAHDPVVNRRVLTMLATEVRDQLKRTAATISRALATVRVDR